MITNTYSCVESITNPEGRFKTLQGIRSVLQDNGMPELYTQSGVVTFNVVYNNKPHQLKCFLDNGSQQALKSNLISNYTSVRQSKYLTRYEYFTDEMLVFDMVGRHRYCDVVLQEMPRGKRLDDFVFECCYENDIVLMDKLYGNMLELIKWMHENNFTHNNFVPRNIIISAQCEPTLINYETAEHTASTNDHIKIGMLFSLFFVAMCHPDHFVETIAKHPLYEDTAPTLIKHISASNVEQAIGNLKILAINICKSKHVIQNWDYLFSTLVSLKALANKNYPSVNNIWQSIVLDSHVAVSISGYDDNHFSYVQSLQDNMRRVGIGEKTYFLDMDDRVVAGPFDYAVDFDEGRACVASDGKYGLIDQNGTFIIPLVYADLSWDGDHNIVNAYDGVHWAILDRCGEPITPFKYDTMFIPSHNRILATINGKYGFLDPKGNVVLDFVYNEASSFAGVGITLVQYGLSVMEIDVNGVVINVRQISEEKSLANAVCPAI